MSNVTAPQVYDAMAGETLNIAVDMGNLLDGYVNEKLTGTPTIAASDEGLTASGAAVTTATRKILEREVPPGEGITFTCAIGSDVTAGEYTLTVTCSTTGSQTRKRVLRLKVATS